MQRSRSLLPREHGAYAQVAAPLVAGLAVRAPSVAAMFLAVAAVCAFLANEPLLVVLGHRGPRARTADGPRARRRLRVLGALGLGLGITGLAMASPPARLLAAGAAVPCVAVLVLAWRRGQHSLGGELVAAVALPALTAPVAGASGIGCADAGIVWAAWTLGYCTSVLAVHRVIARHRAPRGAIDVALGLALFATVAGLVGLGAYLRPALIALPLVATAMVLVARPPRASRLRAIGVVLVVASIASVVVMIVVV